MNLVLTATLLTSVIADVDLDERFGGKLSAQCVDHGIIHARIKPTQRDEFIVSDVLDYGVNPKPCASSDNVFQGTTSSTQQPTSLSILGVHGSPTDDLILEYTVGGVARISASLRSWHGAEGPRTDLAATVTYPRTAGGGVYGIPEHAINYNLPNRRYRLWNLDVYDYKLRVETALYGAIPYVTVTSPDGTAVGFLYLNAAETHVTIGGSGSPDGSATTYNGDGDLPDAGTEAADRSTFWESKHGVYDLYFLPGPTPADVLKQLAFLTGKVQLPPLFAVGYHQCRWNYRDERDVANVNTGFETNDMPVDVLWLDIEHTDGKRYFTYDKHLFPTPKAMINNLAAHGRKLVVITDPHIKRAEGYKVFEEARDGGHFVKAADGQTDFAGKCWPGDSSWIDFANPASRDWYASWFRYDKYVDSAPETNFWIDMNEPSVFESPEVTMPHDNKHFNGRNHDEVRHPLPLSQSSPHPNSSPNHLPKLSPVLPRSSALLHPVPSVPPPHPSSTICTATTRTWQPTRARSAAPSPAPTAPRPVRSSSPVASSRAPRSTAPSGPVTTGPGGTTSSHPSPCSSACRARHSPSSALTLAASSGTPTAS